MIPRHLLLLVACAPLLGGCMLKYALFGFPAPEVTAARPTVEMPYREGPGGLVLIKGRVNDRADVDFILDTGAPVTVLIDGARTAALGLDTREAAPLGNPDDPAAPVGVIQPGFAIRFGDIGVRGLTAVLVPEKTMPCRERMEAVGFGGVVGADLFRRFVVEVDARARKVRFHEPSSWALPAGAAAVPLVMRGGHVYVKAPVRFAQGGFDAELHFDTGMNRGIALNAGADPAIVFPVDGKPRKSCLVNGERDERIGPRAAIALAGRELVDESPAYAAPGTKAISVQKHGSFGIGLLRERRFVIDYPGKRLVLLD